MTSQIINFTKQAIEQLPIPQAGRAVYQDKQEKGLSLYITSHGTKTFFIRKRVRGRDERIIIGSPENTPVEKARRTARVIKGQIAEGSDPVMEKRKTLSNQLTFGKHFKDYMELYSKLHKKSWKHDEREVNKYLSCWFNRRMCDISKYEVQKMQQKVFEQNGLYQSNRIVERISSIYNKAIDWGWEGINPAAKVKKHREKSRDRFVLPAEMPYLLTSIDEEENKTAKDFIWMLLLAGARKTNTLQMRWEQINWDHQTWHIPDSKNGEPLVLPLIDRAMEILKERKEHSTSVWVFPSDKNLVGHFVNVKRVWKRIKQRATLHQWAEDPKLQQIIEETRDEVFIEDYYNLWMRNVIKKAQKENLVLPTGLMDMRLHDIRRTFGSYQAINGASLSVIGKSLGHKSTSATQVYARLSLDPIRASIEKATESMLNTLSPK